MQIRAEVQLIRVRDNIPVPAWLTTLTTQHLNDFRTLWRDRLRTSADEDQYWGWEQKQRIYLSGRNNLYEGYAIECEQATQGFMLLQTNRKMGMIDGGTDPSKETMTDFEWYRRRPTMLEELGIELESDE